MTFLAPVWLAALGALAVPLAIHLLTRGRAPRVRVGSVRLLREARTSSARRIRPSEPLLLAVRMALLALVALALAAPRRVAPEPPPSDRPWVLVDPALGRDGAPNVGGAGDGADLRWLAPGLPEIGGGGSGDLPAAAEVAGGAWSLLREADAAAPPGAPFRILTRGRRAELAGERPGLAREVAWETAPDGETAAWIERAGPRQGPTVPVTVGESDRSGVRFREVSATVGEAGEAVEAVGRDGAAEVRLADARDAEGPLLVPAAVPIGAAILHAPEREVDAAFVAAALAAAAEAVHVPLALESLVLPAEVPPETALAVWLAPDDPPTEAAAGLDLLLLDGGPRWEACPGTLHVPGAEEPLALRRCSPAESVGRTLWSAPEGRPVLLEEASEKGGVSEGPRRFRLLGRFHPAWSDLPLSAELPRWFADILRAELTASGGVAAGRRRDLRIASAGELAPRRDDDARPARPLDPAPERWAWAGVAALAATERLLALGRQR